MRIGINIPNELMKRLEPLKPELNISQVCREALQAKAESHERMQERLENDAVGEAISRTCKQESVYRSVIEVDWEALGIEDAAAWVAQADWEDWRFHHRRAEVLRESGRSPNGWFYVSGKRLKNFDDRITELHDRIQEQDEAFLDWLHLENDGIDQNSAQQEYDTAWLSYTNAVWERIRQMREEHQQKWRSDHAETRRNRPAPEVPEHLLADIGQGR